MIFSKPTWYAQQSFISLYSFHGQCSGLVILYPSYLKEDYNKITGSFDCCCSHLYQLKQNIQAGYILVRAVSPGHYFPE